MQEKSEIRRVARRIRAKLAESATAEEPASLACHFFGGPLANWSNPQKPVVAGYWPYGTEFDVKPLLNYLYEAGHTIVLPVTDAMDLVLQFRVWTPGIDLPPDALGIKAPAKSAEVIAPDIILVPLLAFTLKGDRIGYGAGCYDATLHKIRSQRNVVAVGIGYTAQEVPEIPTDPHDERLDWIVTETYARRVDTP